MTPAPGYMRKDRSGVNATTDERNRFKYGLVVGLLWCVACWLGLVYLLILALE
jgi:hypothetical protein